MSPAFPKWRTDNFVNAQYPTYFGFKPWWVEQQISRNCLFWRWNFSVTSRGSSYISISTNSAGDFAYYSCQSFATTIFRVPLNCIQYFLLTCLCKITRRSFLSVILRRRYQIIWVFSAVKLFFKCPLEKISSLIFIIEMTSKIWVWLCK